MSVCCGCYERVRIARLHRIGMINKRVKKRKRGKGTLSIKNVEWGTMRAMSFKFALAVYQKCFPVFNVNVS